MITTEAHDRVISAAHTLIAERDAEIARLRAIINAYRLATAGLADGISVAVNVLSEALEVAVLVEGEANNA